MLRASGDSFSGISTYRRKEKKVKQSCKWMDEEVNNQSTLKFEPIWGLRHSLPLHFRMVNLKPIKFQVRHCSLTELGLSWAIPLSDWITGATITIDQVDVQLIACNCCRSTFHWKIYLFNDRFGTLESILSHPVTDRLCCDQLGLISMLALGHHHRIRVLWN